VAGPSGAGKALAARAIHASSARAARALVVATNPPPGASLVADLFGNAADHPEPGAPERAGLFGEADGSTLFVAELADLSPAMRTYLVRVLEDGGQYKRVGDKRRRSIHLRLVAATARKPDDLDHDLLARIPLRLPVPGLDERREDIPLLVRCLLRRLADHDTSLGARFFDGWPSRSAWPRVSLALMNALLIHDYRGHVRELDALVTRAATSSDGNRLALTEAVLQAMYEGAR
jgi:two-component system nitrogen regulation response regulator GlnG/two-component system response regulator HydG